MKALSIGLATMLLAVSASASIVVLRGGKRVEAERWEQKGNLVVIYQADGKVQSYPLGAVDMAATREANRVPAPEEAKREVPSSPFLRAVATPGAAAVSITDADVSHPAPIGEEAAGEGGAAAEGNAQVVLLGQNRKQLESGEWEITTTVANQGGATARGVAVNVRLLDEKGAVVGQGSGSLSAGLDGGSQATLTVRVQATGEPTQVDYDIKWESLRPKEVKVVPTPVGKLAGERPRPAAEPASLPGYSVPAGSSPNTMPTNMMALPPVNVAPAPPQVARPTPLPQ